MAQSLALRANLVAQAVFLILVVLLPLELKFVLLLSVVVVVVVDLCQHNGKHHRQGRLNPEV